jgi:hypothetical protein
MHPPRSAGTDSRRTYKESTMNANSPLYRNHRHRFANVTQRELRVRALGQVGAIATLAALVLVAVALAGCDPIAPVGATASTAGNAAAQETATQKTGFDWRKADPVTYVPADWETLDKPTEY